MGFSLRKLFRIGKTNISVSKKGIGVSTKVAGVRVGLTPQGKVKASVKKGLFSWTKILGTKKRKRQ